MPMIPPIALEVKPLGLVSHRLVQTPYTCHVSQHAYVASMLVGSGSDLGFSLVMDQIKNLLRGFLDEFTHQLSIVRLQNRVLLTALHQDHLVHVDKDKIARLIARHAHKCCHCAKAL
jgi:hypothetical protein